MLSSGVMFHYKLGFESFNLLIAEGECLKFLQRAFSRLLLRVSGKELRLTNNKTVTAKGIN